MDGCHGRVPGHAHRLCRRLGRGCALSRSGHAAQSRTIPDGIATPPSRCLPQGRLPRGARRGAPAQHAQTTSNRMRCWPCARRSSAGRRRRARRYGTLLALKPDFAAVARRNCGKWYRPRAGGALARRPAQGGAGDCRRRPAKPCPCGRRHARAPPAPTRDSGSRCCRSSTAARRRAHGPGRGPDRRHRHRPVAVLLPSRDRPGLDRDVCRRGGGRAGGRQGARRALRDGRQPAAGRDETAPRRTARRRDDPAPISGPRTTSAPSARRRSSSSRTSWFPRIVSTVADMHGILPRSMSEAVRGKRSRGAEPVRGRAAQLRLLRSGSLPRSSPRRAPAWSWRSEGAGPCRCLGDAGACCACRTTRRDSTSRPDSLASSGLTAARRAVEAAPSNPLAHFGLAQALFFLKEFPSFPERGGAGASRSIPWTGTPLAFLGELMTYAGDWERGLRAGGARQAAQSPSSRLVLVCRLLRRLPPGRLPRRARVSRSRPTCRATGARTRRWRPPTGSSGNAMRRRRP